MHADKQELWQKLAARDADAAVAEDSTLVCVHDVCVHRPTLTWTCCRIGRRCTEIACRSGMRSRMSPIGTSTGVSGTVYRVRVGVRVRVRVRHAHPLLTTHAAGRQRCGLIVMVNSRMHQE